MMRLARSAPLLVAFSLLTSAATAHAECAWVLWERTTTWKALPEKVEETRWAPVRAASAQPICESSKANRIKETARNISSASRPKDTIMPTDDSVMWSWEEPDGTKGAQLFRFLCLPDNLDPRGEKGK